MDVGVTDLKGESGSVVVRREDEGVEIVDDWNGFGQQLTASGTAYFHDVLVDEAEILPDDDRFKYSAAYYQLVQLAIITGLGRAATYDVSQAVAKRTRNYTHANAQFVKQDPQILQVVGQIRGAAYSAGAIVEKLHKAYSVLTWLHFKIMSSLKKNKMHLPSLKVRSLKRSLPI